MWTKLTNLLPTQKIRALFLAAVLFVCVGLSNIITANELKPNLPSYQAYEAQFMLVEGLAFWGSLFVISGLVAIVTAFWKRFAYVGYFSLMFMSAWWAGLFAASLLTTGYTRIIPSIFVWALISVFLYTISSWPEVPKSKEISWVGGESA